MVVGRKVFRPDFILSESFITVVEGVMALRILKTGLEGIFCNISALVKALVMKDDFLKISESY